MARIVLTETEREYLLQIPAYERERAKQIRPRHWDAERLRWIYPRNQRVYQELLDEFGADAEVRISSPEPAAALLRDAPQGDENARRLGRIERQLQDLFDALANNNTEVLVQELKARYERELKQTRAELQRVSAQLAEARQEQEIALKRVEQLEEEHPDPEDVLEDALRQLALRTAGDEGSFRAFLEQEKLDGHFPSQAQKALLEKLRTGKRDAQPSTKIDRGLSGHGRELAHTLRKIRNHLQHETVDPRTIDCYSYTTLLLLALLWPHLPEHEKTAPF